MIFFGHIGITIFLLSFLFIPFLYSGIGAILPDILDKSINVLGLNSCTRYVGHTIFFAPATGLATFIFTRNKKAAAAILLGGWLHLAQDATLPLPLFYPVLPYEFDCRPVLIGERIGRFEIITEAIGLFLLILAIKRNEKIRKFFLTKVNF